MLHRAARQFIVVVAALGGMTWSPIQAATPPRATAHDKLLSDYDQRLGRFEKQILELAKEADPLDPAEARRLRATASQPDERVLELLVLPESHVPDPPPDLPQDLRNLLQRIRAVESDYAIDLFKLVNRAVGSGQYSLAWRLVRETAYRDPDHAGARKTLGFVDYKGTWTTPFRKQKLENGSVWTEHFGWIKSADKSKYEMGLEPAPDGQWLRADQVAAIRSDFAYGWVVDSEHFHIQSNHSLARAVQISVELERFHDYFVREFAEVFMTPQQMPNLFAGGVGGIPATRRSHLVHYYRDREEFKKRLMAKQQEAAFSDGLYRAEEFTAYFFDRPGQEEKVAETMYHEVTHQILSESRRQRKPIGAENWVDGDFWLVEGLACYLESFKPAGRGGTVGDPKHPRIDWARRFAIDENFYIPLEKFTAMSQRDFQCADMPNGPDRVDRLQHHYAQAAGVTHFFMHAGDGRYRDALIKYLSQIYSADQKVRKNNNSLAELTGVSFKELDQQYIEYMRGLETTTTVRVRVDGR